METLPEKMTRPAEDIAEDIGNLIRSYPPLVQSRHHFTYDVRDGVVTLRGNVKSAVAYRVLLDNVPDIPGVERVTADELFNDAELTRRITHEVELPPGVLVRVDFGCITLEGSPSLRPKASESLIKKVAQIRGVRKIENKLR